MVVYADIPRVAMQVSRGVVVASIQVALDDDVVARFQEDLLGRVHETAPRGVILDRNLEEVLPVDAEETEQIQEQITHSWYEWDGGGDTPRHPWNEVTRLNYTGPKPYTYEGESK